MSAPAAATLPGAAEALDARVRAARARLAPLRALYPFEPRFHAAPGGCLHYVDEGAGEPLLFVHGNPTWSFAWRRAIGALAPGRRCVALDHLGCGLSDKPQDAAYTLAQHVENLESLVLALDLRRLTLVLHDWGGAIGMGFARRHPGRVARLAFLNTAAFPSTRMPLRIAACRVPLFGALAVRGLNAFARAATHMAVRRPLPAAVKRGYLLPYDSWRNRIATLAFVEDIPMDPRHPSWAELTAIEAALPSFGDRPVALLWGERDWCFTPAFRAEFERRLPRAETTRFPDAGHYLFEDEGEGVVRALADFLERHPLPPAEAGR